MFKWQLYILICCFGCCASGCKTKSELPDLKETYASRNTKPFGGNIAFRILQNSFPDNYVQQVKTAFEDPSLSMPDTSSLYFCLANHFYIRPGDVDAILEFVDQGNTFFLSSANIDTQLLNAIYCKVTKKNDINLLPPYFKETSVRLAGYQDSSINQFSYFYLPFRNSFSELNDIYCRIVGYNDGEDVNCIVFFWGKGKLFLHTDPRAFSNYFLLRDSNYLYMKRLLQLMGESPQHVYWNDYYNQRSSAGRSGNNSFLDAIFKSPPLSAAFWISLMLILLFILFEIKRRQRVIKLIEPNVNSSIAFTETIARLYFQKRDNKNIAEKMIHYFYEYIRSNYYLYAITGSDDFIKALSKKSGISLERTTALFAAIAHASQSDKLDDYQLLSLNEQIQQFYKK